MSSPSIFRTRGRALLAAALASSLLATGLTAIDWGFTPEASAHGAFGSLATGAQPFAVARAGAFVYVGNRADGTVTVLDSTDWSLETTIAVGANPYYLSVNADDSEVWVSNLDDGSITIIDTATNTAGDTLFTGGAPREVVFPSNGLVGYVLNSTLGLVQAVDLDTHAITEIGSPMGLITHGELSADETMLYFVSQSGADRVQRLDLTSGAHDYNALPSLGPDFGGVNIVTSPDGSELWVTSSSGSVREVLILNATASVVIDTIPLVGDPAWLEFSVAGDFAYVSTYATDQVALIDVGSREVITLISAGDEPTGIVALPSGLAAVADAAEDRLSVIGLTTERLAGIDRFSTAVAVSQKTFPTGIGTVFVANGLDFPDALAAGPAAGKLDASLLLTRPGLLPAAVADEITRLNPDTIYIVGGTSVVSTAVETALAAIQPNVIRLAGSTRYDTAAAIVDEAWNGLTVPEVFIATGRNYPDALSAGAVAAAEGIPVILVDGTLASVPQATLDQIALLAPTQITIAGGTGVVSAAIQTQLSNQFSGVRRLAGIDRYATSAAINVDAYVRSESLIYATGANFADALAGATLAARADAPVYLVKPTCVTQAALDANYIGQSTYLFLLGGTGSLSTAVENLTACP